MKWRSIISFHFTRTNVHETTQLETLLEPHWGFNNVLADSGYLSADNCLIITMKGGTPYIRPKKTTTGKTSKIRAFKEMIQRYNENPEQWMHTYHQRSNVEAVFSSLKRRFGGFVTSIKRKIQQIEIAYKIIVYNLMILVKKIVEEEYF